MVEGPEGGGVGGIKLVTVLNKKSMCICVEFLNVEILYKNIDNFYNIYKTSHTIINAGLNY